jgi:quercetin dioxygenase-like cupin family protein
MPYVAPGEALNAPALDLAAVERDMGPPPWRRPLVGTPRTRVALIAWPPGFVAAPHVHPRADEVFQVLRGRAAFRFGDGPDVAAAPGTTLLGPAGIAHAIRVIGDEPLVFLAAVSPNEDAPDETVESG